MNAATSLPSRSSLLIVWLTAEAVLIVGEADVKLAAQVAINAAVGVLKKAVNEAAGLVLL